MEKIKSYLLEDMLLLKQVVLELNIWNGSLHNLDYHENDEEFFQVYFEGDPMGAVRATHYGSYDYTDAYVRFNGYGNLESFNDYQYDEELENNIDDIVQVLLGEYQNIHIDDERLKRLLDSEIEN